jgi:hypothetical protein
MLRNNEIEALLSPLPSTTLKEKLQAGGGDIANTSSLITD